MKLLLATLLSVSLSHASIDTIKSFTADFTQSVTDDKNATLEYSGNLAAVKPQNAVWHYTNPILKDVYIDRFRVTIVEPEIEQVIIRKIETKFDFFKMIQNAKKINDTLYEARYQEAIFIIKIENNIIQTISYKDAFENNVKIIFTNQKQNIEIDDQAFVAKYPLEFDVIRD